MYKVLIVTACDSRGQLPGLKIDVFPRFSISPLEAVNEAILKDFIG